LLPDPILLFSIFFSFLLFTAIAKAKDDIKNKVRDIHPVANNYLKK